MTLNAWVKQQVLHLARVPADPQVPAGAQGSARVFNAGRNYFVWRMISWAVANSAVALVLFVALAMSYAPKMPPVVHKIWLTLVVVVFSIFVISLPFTYFLQRLNYEMRWYIVTDRSLLIRSGVVWLQEMTMTFANIQEIRINANPIERLLGLANVEVRSAGGGGSGEHGQSSTGHVGKFEGVDNAEAIRDLMVERLRVYRDSGLGEKTVEAQEPPALTAAREVLQEARSLRNAFPPREHAT